MNSGFSKSILLLIKSGVIISIKLETGSLNSIGFNSLFTLLEIASLKKDV